MKKKKVTPKNTNTSVHKIISNASLAGTGKLLNLPLTFAESH